MRRSIGCAILAVALSGCPVPPSFPDRCQGTCSDPIDNAEHALRTCRATPFRSHRENEPLEEPDDACVGKVYLNLGDALTKQGDAPGASRAYWAAAEAIAHQDTSRFDREEALARSYRGLAVAADVRNQHEWAKQLRLAAALAELYTSSEEGRREKGAFQPPEKLTHSLKDDAAVATFEDNPNVPPEEAFHSTFLSRRVSHYLANTKEPGRYLEMISVYARDNGWAELTSADANNVGPALDKREHDAFVAERLRFKSPPPPPPKPPETKTEKKTEKKTEIVTAEPCPKNVPKKICDALTACRANDGEACSEIARYNASEANPRNVPLAVKILHDKCEAGLAIICRNLAKWSAAGKLIPRDPKQLDFAASRGCELGDAPSCELRTAPADGGSAPP